MAQLLRCRKAIAHAKRPLGTGPAAAKFSKDGYRRDRIGGADVDRVPLFVNRELS
jgi:hypothetical protein